MTMPNHETPPDLALAALAGEARALAADPAARFDPASRRRGRTALLSATQATPATPRGALTSRLVGVGVAAFLFLLVAMPVMAGPGPVGEALSGAVAAVIAKGQDVLHGGGEHADSHPDRHGDRDADRESAPAQPRRHRLRGRPRHARARPKPRPAGARGCPRRGWLPTTGRPSWQALHGSGISVSSRPCSGTEGRYPARRRSGSGSSPRSASGAALGSATAVRWPD